MLVEENIKLQKRIEALEKALRAATPTHCDACGRAFKPDDDVVLLGERGNYHQDCFRQNKPPPYPVRSGQNKE